MAATLLELYDALRASLGEKQAANIASFIDLHSKNAKEQQAEIFASKIDLTEVKLELKNDINGLRNELAVLKTDLTKSIGDTKTRCNKMDVRFVCYYVIGANKRLF